MKPKPEETICSVRLFLRLSSFSVVVAAHVSVSLSLCGLSFCSLSLCLSLSLSFFLSFILSFFLSLSLSLSYMADRAFC